MKAISGRDIEVLAEHGFHGLTRMEHKWNEAQTIVFPRPARRGEGQGEGIEFNKISATAPRPSPPFHGGEGENERAAAWRLPGECRHLKMKEQNAALCRDAATPDRRKASLQTADKINAETRRARRSAENSFCSLRNSAFFAVLSHNIVPF